MYRVIPVPDFHKKMATIVKQLHKNSGRIWRRYIVEHVQRTQKCSHCRIMLQEHTTSTKQRKHLLFTKVINLTGVVYSVIIVNNNLNTDENY